MSPSTCPYCGASAADIVEEIEHMRAQHPEVITERLAAIGEYQCPNGHPFPWPHAVKCDKCDASVVTVPTSEVYALRERMIEWAESLDLYASTHDGSPEMVRAVAVEMRVAARGVS